MDWQVSLFDPTPQLLEQRDALRDALLDAAGSGRYVGGPAVAGFEEEIAAYLGVSHAIGVSSGSDALLAALMALGVGRGDLVLTTDYSFFSTAGSVARLGAEPVFLEIEADTMNLDPRALEGWLEAHAHERPHVKAIVPVHLFGQCADMGRILELGALYGIPVVEDAAQAMGARCPTHDGHLAGSMGTLGCFSFFPSKNLGAMGDGGLVVTQDDDLAERVRRLARHGEEDGTHTEVGGNFRLDALQAAILSVKLPRLENWNRARRALAARYDEAFAGLPLHTPALAGTRDHHAYNHYVIRVPEHRDALREHLARNEIETRSYYPRPLHREPCFTSPRDALAKRLHAEAAAHEALALPLYPGMSEEQQDFVIETLRAF